MKKNVQPLIGRVKEFIPVGGTRLLSVVAKQLRVSQGNRALRAMSRRKVG